MACSDLILIEILFQWLKTKQQAETHKQAALTESDSSKGPTPSDRHMLRWYMIIVVIITYLCGIIKTADV